MYLGLFLVGLIAWSWQESRLIRKYGMTKRRYWTIRFIVMSTLCLAVFAGAVAIGVAAYDWLV